MSDLEALTERVRNSVKDDEQLDAKVKFTFKEGGIIFIDAKQQPPVVTNEDAESDITLTMKEELFKKILDHETKPQTALMTGRMRLRGDMRIALRLNPVFGIE